MSYALFGHYALCLAWLLSIAGLCGGVIAGTRKDLSRAAAWSGFARNSTLLVGVCCGASIAALAYAFMNDDYTNQYVWQHSNKDMLPMYKIAAIWGGMDGSMLLWAFILSVSASLVAWRAPGYPRSLIPWVLATLCSSLLFFLTVVVFCTNPFRFLKADFIPPDGNGLNPLLQNPYMAIHPPMLYLGFTTFTVPYAFCMGALLSGALGNDWIRLTRVWTLLAWMFLTFGIVLGGHWAYLELGWGGFWAWDPVENSSFLPWLTGTAFLHSVMVQERKNMLKFWNVWLIVITYGLTVFGTFLTRSGVVESVHAFASTDVGWVFLLYLGIIFCAALVLCVWRRGTLRSERRIESFLSREAAFLLNNLLFLSICFAVLWGVLFPVLSEAVTGKKQAVGIPFFNAINVPLFLALIFLMGVGPLVAWRKASLQSIRRTFLSPFLIGLGSAALLVWAGVDEYYPVLSYGLCVFVALTILGEFHRGLSAQKLSSAAPQGQLPARAARLFRRHRSRYGGYIIHFGVLIATIGITASMAHKYEQEFVLKRGESVEARRFTLQLKELGQESNDNYIGRFALIDVQAGGESIGELKPEMRHYLRSREMTTEVALRMGLREDLYLVLAGLDEEQGQASFKVFINPLQVWLWFGVLIMGAGTLIVLVPGIRVTAARTASEALQQAER